MEKIVKFRYEDICGTMRPMPDSPLAEKFHKIFINKRRRSFMPKEIEGIRELGELFSFTVEEYTEENE